MISNSGDFKVEFNLIKKNEFKVNSNLKLVKLTNIFFK